MRFSTSFSEEEIAFLDGLLRTLLRGGDASMFVRSRSFANVMRKVISMKEKLEKGGTTTAPPEDEDPDYDPDYSEGNQLGALNPGEHPDEGD